MNQTAEGLASTSELSPGDSRRFSLGHAGGPVGGVGQAGTFSGGAQVNYFSTVLFKLFVVHTWVLLPSGTVESSDDLVFLYELLCVLYPLENCVIKF